MTEEFLHYLWKFQNYTKNQLVTEGGEALQIIHPGQHNHNSGPDFSNARIRIGNKLWAGNVEIHIDSSDWYRHGHQHDEAYGNVILHVVYRHNKEIPDQNGHPIPVLALIGRFDEYQYWRYEQLVQTREAIPCATQFRSVDPFIVQHMFERVLVERIEIKSKQILDIWVKNQKDWSESFYQWMARGYGLKVNAEPMLVLARSIPRPVLAKHRDNLFQLEALLFGISGLLQKPKDDYALKLKQEFTFLQKKYQLSPLPASVWKYARLRPASFPDLRIGQFAALIHRRENLFSQILATETLRDLQQILSELPALYWRNHYRFGLKKPRACVGVGEGFQQILLINAIVPFLFIYGKTRGESIYQQRALDLLEHLPAEDNKISRIYQKLGAKVTSAFHSQASIQLYNHYCQPKKCLNCQLGNYLLKA